MNLNVVELEACALCALNSVSDALNDNWKKHFEQLKTSFSVFSNFDMQLLDFDSFLIPVSLMSNGEKYGKL